MTQNLVHIPCDHKTAVDRDPLRFFCHNSHVHSMDNVVTEEICKSCEFRQTPVPDAILSTPSCREAGLDRLRTAPTSGEDAVAVVITCHNYGRYLDQCIRSVQAQTLRPAEIVVVDNASTDETAAVASRYYGEVQFTQIKACDPLTARSIGLHRTTSSILCFLDADDVLSPDYLASGVPAFRDAHVGVVYSDWDRIDEHGVQLNEPSAFPATVDAARLGIVNDVHCAALVRRAALGIADPFTPPPDGMPEDYWMWKQIVSHGWRFVKQEAILLYRRHAAQRSRALAKKSYGEQIGISREAMTIAVPLSGRRWAWPRSSHFLNRQTWPREQCRLLLYDTSQDADFSWTIRNWIGSCDYPDVHHVVAPVGPKGVADAPRRENSREVDLLMCRIYGRISKLIKTQWALIIEDDVIPPDDVVSRLVAAIDRSDVATVSAPYRSRFDGNYVVWSTKDQTRTLAQRPAGSDVQEIGASGFGCLLVRVCVLRSHVFWTPAEARWFDPAFFRGVRKHWRCLIDWSCLCEHVEPQPGEGASQDKNTPYSSKLGL